MNKSQDGRMLRWDIPHFLILLCVLLSYLYHWRTNSDINIFMFIVALTIGVGILTAIVWRFAAMYTVQAFKSVFDLLNGRNDFICRVKSPQSVTESKSDHLYMAIEWCLFPTLVVFFVLSFIAQGIAPEGKSMMESHWIWIFMFLIPPLATIIAIPIRLLTDSSLMRFNTQSRILEPFGLTFKRMFRAVGGVGAMASFAKVALNKGGVWYAMKDTFTILLFVFPLIFIATIFYGFWHPKYLREVERKIESFHYQNYEYSRNYEGLLELLPISEKEKNVEPAESNQLNSRRDEISTPDQGSFPWEIISKNESGTTQNERIEDERIEDEDNENENILLQNSEGFGDEQCKMKEEYDKNEVEGEQNGMDCDNTNDMGNLHRLDVENMGDLENEEDR